MLHDLGGVLVRVAGGSGPADPATDVCVATGEPGPGWGGGGEATLDGLRSSVERWPLAAGVLVQVLRLTETLPAPDALVVESLAYSTLLAGPEFAQWLAGRPEPDPLPGADEPVLLERDGDELVLTLNRPERHNAFAAAVRDALYEALEVALADPSLRVRLRGAGRSFSSGGDLAEFGTTPDVATAHVIRMSRSVAARLTALGDRLTVEVQGACVGAGVELAAFGGRVIADRRAFFRLPEVSMGLIPGAGGTVSVPRRIGRHRAAYLALTGRRLRADQALDWGLVDELR